MWARIHDRAVVETTDVDPTGRFHQSLSWAPAPAGTAIGDLVEGASFVRPPAASAALASRIPLSTVVARLKAAGLWAKFAAAVEQLSAEQRWGLLWEGRVSAEDQVMQALLAGVGADPKVILA